MSTGTCRLLRLLARCLVGGVFVYAGAVKLADPGSFAREIFAYRLLPEAGAWLVALTLPAQELLCGSLLLSKRWHRPAALAILAMLAVFALALASALLRGLEIECGCFGQGSTSIGSALLRDLGLGLATLFALTGDERPAQP